MMNGTKFLKKKKAFRVRAFIVDDSEVMREHLIDMLSEIPGIEIAGQAQNAQEAMNSIRKLKPDVAIIDIRMPGGGGIEVLKNVKKGKSAPLVIILTNYPYPQYRRKCIEAGADYFFDKSSEFEKVIKVFKKLIQKSNARRDHSFSNQRKGIKSDKK